VPNLASRICSEAKPGQILISQRVLSAVEDLAETEPLGAVSLKACPPDPVFDVLQLKTSEALTTR